jgi:hypothetical protein
MKLSRYYQQILILALLGVAALQCSCTQAQDPPPAIQVERKPIDSLSQEEIWARYLNNPCYLPLITDENMWQKDHRAGFTYMELFNRTRKGDDPYAKRYLVGDFNVIDRFGNNKGIYEHYPHLWTLLEFADLPLDLVAKMDSTRFGTPDYDSLLIEIRTRVPEQAPVVINFLEKVWNYKMLPVDREFSILGRHMYAVGQSIVMCEACGDTLKMIGNFAVSGKRIDYWTKVDSTTGKEKDTYFQYIPVGTKRKYYAGLNTISARHWEWGRKYDSLDMVRDELLGGGDRQVVVFRKRAQLPNFMSVEPASELFPGARRRNGIHEVSPIDGARGMLGTANSLGCLRVTDFASKFLRWWVPMGCNFFIAYNDTCYHKEIEYEGDILDYLPFQTQEEGDAFRLWINEYEPFYAKILQVDEEGDFRNGYIIDAYFHLQDKYDAYLESLKEVTPDDGTGLKSIDGN